MPILGATDAFPLRAVLELVATTNRTGRLVVQAGDHTALFAFREGRALASGIAQGAATPGVQVAAEPGAVADTVAELEALGTGQFAFHSGGIGGTATGFDIGAVLGALDQRAGVPEPDGLAQFASAAARVRLAGDVTFRHQQIDEADWAVLRAIGDGADVAAIAARLGVSVRSAATRLAALHELGMITSERPVPSSWAAPLAQAG